MNLKFYTWSNCVFDAPEVNHRLLSSSTNYEIITRETNEMTALRQSFYARSTSLKIKVANITCDDNFCITL